MSIEISINGLDLTRSGLEFLYNVYPTVLRLNPSAVLASQYKTWMITLVGAHFTLDHSLMVRIGSRDKMCRVTSPSSSLLLCPVSDLLAGNHSVQLALLGEDAHSGLALHVQDRVELLEVQPSSGPKNGRLHILLVHRPMLPAGPVFCLFDTLYAAAVHLSNSVLSCDVPAAVQGTVNICIGNYKKECISNYKELDYYPSHNITEVSPSLANSLGGSPVSVCISFDSATTHTSSTWSCCFGGCKIGTQVQAVVVQSSSTVINLSCVVPAGAAGRRVALGIAFGGVSVAEKEEAFEYLSFPRLLKLLPSTGPSSSAQMLTLVGADLPTNRSATSVRMGMSLLTSTFLSSSMIICMTK